MNRPVTAATPIADGSQPSSNRRKKRALTLGRSVLSGSSSSFIYNPDAEGDDDDDDDDDDVDAELDDEDEEEDDDE